MDVNIASAIKEQIEDNFKVFGLNKIDVSSYSELLNSGRTLRRVKIWSYVFFDQTRRVRVDVLEGKIYSPGCGGSDRELAKVAKRITL